jgi:amino acid adenylation domain-containing protein
VEWNATGVGVPGCGLPELFAREVRRGPGRVAVRCGGEELSFGELDARANQLARYLGGLGVGPEVLVGIAVERSVEMLVGLWGVLKAGGAYVPIDPGYPVARQEFMLERSEVGVLLTQERLVERLALGGVQAVCLDRDWPVIAQCSRDAPEVSVSPDSLAYVIYTSGSTGEPKGVQIEHRALVNFLTAMARQPGLSAEDVLVAVTTLSFDIAGLELYLPLLVGAPVVVAPAATASDPLALARLLQSSAATVMQATPTTWRMLLDAGWVPQGPFKALCGGEPLPVALADRLLDAGVELWNMYGPTETTIWSTCAPISTRGRALTIGRPIANTSLYILDPRMQPVPIGVTGELWIGGHGLARGYRGRPDLTHERFLPNPFDPTPGARIYRTGDLARYQPDGHLHYLGRTDTQVKVRGHRIELGEIETTLTHHPHITQAIVTTREDTPEQAELAAYITTTTDPPPTTRELREHIAKALPAYMVPTTITTLNEFPLTPNGKIDRAQLPQPQRERSADHELLAPRTPLERRLTDIWQRQLGIASIGISDDFFDLGVSSVAAATLFATIEREIGSRLPLGAIFSARTIAALAELIEAPPPQSRWASLIPIQAQGTQPPIFCVHGGAGTILHLAPLARRLGPDQPFYALQARGLYGGAPPLRTVEEMAAFYLSEMRDVHPGGPWLLTGYCFGALVAFELARILTAAGEPVELLAGFNGASPSWLRAHGWYGNQPTLRAAAPHSPDVAVRVAAPSAGVLSQWRRLTRAVREPRRFLGASMWYARRPLTRALLALGRPVPERLREDFFIELHAKVQVAYDPAPYDGEMLIFRGDGLYEDPALGWEGLARGGIQSFAVPGRHDNNRQAMAEPAVGFIADTLEAYLSPRR